MLPYGWAAPCLAICWRLPNAVMITKSAGNGCIACTLRTPLTMTINCPLCASTRSILFDQRSFRQVLVSNRACLECGLVYQSPRMSDQDLEAFYEEEYRQVYQGSQEPSPRTWRSKLAALIACWLLRRKQSRKLARTWISAAQPGGSWSVFGRHIPAKWLESNPAALIAAMLRGEG